MLDFEQLSSEDKIEYLKLRCLVYDLQIQLMNKQIELKTMTDKLLEKYRPVDQKDPKEN